MNEGTENWHALTEELLRQKLNEAAKQLSDPQDTIQMAIAWSLIAIQKRLGQLCSAIERMR